MDFEKYTERARGFVQAAQNLALREGHQQFTPEHVLKVLLDDEEGLAAGLIRKAGGRPEEALEPLGEALAAWPRFKKLAAEDDDLASLREDARFQALVAA